MLYHLRSIHFFKRMWPNSFYRERELQYMKNMKSGERKILTHIYCHTYPAGHQLAKD